ncbi:MAG: DNA repair protein RecN [Odoribacteraceae bacterium]|jgi:DNA repair protein RecN (Recombination protein N)|nr:DNA repair protein RecN [Odoribacteraceae bacterium]
MIKSIRIHNYALIDGVEVEMGPGFSVITGETGAGKSILLGAIGLTLGNRADASVIMDKGRKCVTEVTYDAGGYALREWFEENDLDYADEVVVRREIHADGRSRAFINDTPASNKTLKELGQYLVDIHSQHQSLLIGQPGYQVEVLDRFCGNRAALEEYRERYKLFRALERERDERARQREEAAREEEFLRFQFNRLEAARLREGEQRELEEELSLLAHAEGIKAALEGLSLALTGAGEPVVQVLRGCRHRLSPVEGVLKEAGEYGERLQSVILELQDIAGEAERRAERVEFSAERAREAQARLDELYDLLHKHRAADVDELIRLRDSLAGRLREAGEYERREEELAARARQAEAELDALAQRLHDARAGAAGALEEEMRALLVELGMPHARFSVAVEGLPGYAPAGRDNVRFFFSANKNHEPGELSRVASGGEISRLMLSMKYILSRDKLLPAIIFDEIDTGVSGEIAHRVATMLKRMSARAQVISISHLPQIAATGDLHFKVYKEDGPRGTLSRVKRLSDPERVTEIAAMISGSAISEVALENARLLLRQGRSPGC